MNLYQILDPIKPELSAVEATLQNMARVEYEILSHMIHYTVSGVGKRIRPAMILLAAHLYPSNLDRVVSWAAAIEALHTATLIHDDLVDHATKRRGRPTINALWAEGASVLVGDYIFAQAANLAAATGSVNVMQSFAKVLATILSGEIDQAFCRSYSLPKRKVYYQRISRKTASLFSVAVRSTGVLINAPASEIEALEQYGYHFGMAYQIIDDVLDFIGEPDSVGKPIGNDLREGTITLPVFYFAETHPDHSALSTYLNGNHNREAAAADLAQAVIDSAAIKNALEEAMTYTRRAAEALSKMCHLPTHKELCCLAELMVTERVSAYMQVV